MKRNLRKNDRIINEYRKQFYNIYYTNVIPIFAKFERERKKKLFQLISIELVIVAFSIISIFTFGEVLDFPVVVLSLVFIPCLFNYKFIEKLKNNCMSMVVKAFYNMHWANRHEMFSDKELHNCQLFAEYNFRVSGDTFEGVYKDVQFKIAETTMSLYGGYFQTRHHLGAYIFNGVIIKLKANKNIRNTTIITTKNYNNIKIDSSVRILIFSVIFFSIIVILLHYDLISTIIFFVLIFFVSLVLVLVPYYRRRKDIKGLNEIVLENSQFNKYKVYSSDRIACRYLITSEFIERFNNLQKVFGTNRARCYFSGDEIMFAIPTNKNLFEIGNIFYSLNDPKQMRTFFNELSSIIALVDYFKSDEMTEI